MLEPLVVFRLEWDNKGPFWCEKTRRLLQRLCRQSTPEWKQKEGPSTFLDYYIANAPSPYESPAMDWHLSRVKEGDSSLSFGFVSKEELAKQFGLEHEMYAKQFKELLNRPECSVKALMAPPLVSTAVEALFRRDQAELLDVASSWEDFLRL